MHSLKTTLFYICLSDRVTLFYITHFKLKESLKALKRTEKRRLSETAPLYKLRVCIRRGITSLVDRLSLPAAVVSARNGFASPVL